LTSRDEKLNRVLTDVLDLPESEISDALSPDTCDTWTSLMHLNLILAIESEFGLSISPEDSLDLLTVGIIRMYLKEQSIAD